MFKGKVALEPYVHHTLMLWMARGEREREKRERGGFSKIL